MTVSEILQISKQIGVVLVIKALKMAELTCSSEVYKVACHRLVLSWWASSHGDHNDDDDDDDNYPDAGDENIIADMQFIKNNPPWNISPNQAISAWYMISYWSLLGLWCLNVSIL